MSNTATVPAKTSIEDVNPKDEGKCHINLATAHHSSFRHPVYEPAQWVISELFYNVLNMQQKCYLIDQFNTDRDKIDFERFALEAKPFIDRGVIGTQDINNILKVATE
jgi:hypothetical protein